MYTTNFNPYSLRSKRSFGNTVRRALGHAAARRASSFTSVEAFTKRQNGSVDVWWLYDDGGKK